VLTRVVQRLTLVVQRLTLVVQQLALVVRQPERRTWVAGLRASAA